MNKEKWRKFKSDVQFWGIIALIIFMLSCMTYTLFK